MSSFIFLLIDGDLSLYFYTCSSLSEHTACSLSEHLLSLPTAHPVSRQVVLRMQSRFFAAGSPVVSHGQVNVYFFENLGNSICSTGIILETLSSVKVI